MLEIIGWEILVFGFLCTITIVKSRSVLAFAVIAGAVFAGLLIAQGSAARNAIAMLGGPSTDELLIQARATIERTDDLQSQIAADQARLENLYRQYPELRPTSGQRAQ